MGIDAIEPFLCELIQSHDAGPGNRAFVLIDKGPNGLVCSLRVEGVKQRLRQANTLFDLLHSMCNGLVKTVLNTQRAALLKADAEIPPGTWIVRPVGNALKIGSPGTHQTWTLSDLLKT